MLSFLKKIYNKRAYATPEKFKDNLEMTLELYKRLARAGIEEYGPLQERFHFFYDALLEDYKNLYLRVKGKE
jgi:hypothetical protein